ncbi:ankyrin repeat and death domain-containing protein 1A-like [Acipenser oxyrinchus oxyrinchus]|uniref:Ankyrin repeat and death domain-containing protein 1A-like n=1 Tax=Acipenser oxyrinchus oxyrinchus TaxID=40147 RepID=A0AAD8CHL2_ACIOX|nr:ankyrin repeat and death domain-containing protein 1A-like [Acipenser oxyrinchus oxyrinchus]
MEDEPSPEDERLLRLEKELHEAAKRNDTRAALALLKSKVHVNARDSVNRAALHWASARGHELTVQTLIHYNAIVDLEDKFGMTPAMYSAWFGHIRILQMLVNAGATVTHENSTGQGLLHCAAARGHLDIINYILGDLEEMPLDKMDKLSKTPFLLAAENGRLPVVQCFLGRGCDITLTDQDGKTALHLAAEGGHYQCVEALLDCSLSALCDKGYSALHYAVEQGHGEICRLLLQSGSHLNSSTKVAPLHLAVINNFPHIVLSCIEAGCDLNVTDLNEQTALHIAVEMRRLVIVELLLVANVNIYLKDKQNKTPLDVAVRGYYANIVDMIIKAERFYRWRQDIDPQQASQIELDFTLDHAQEPKHVRSVLWQLATKYLPPGGWKKLANYWQFPAQHVKAIEAQWTGNKSYKEHGYRMLLVWLHGISAEGKHPIKCLYESLVETGNRVLAEKVRKKANEDESIKKCPLM